MDIHNDYDILRVLDKKRFTFVCIIKNETLNMILCNFFYGYIVTKQRFVRFILTEVFSASVYFMLFQFHLALIPNVEDHDFTVSSRLHYLLEENECTPTQQGMLMLQKIIEDIIVSAEVLYMVLVSLYVIQLNTLKNDCVVLEHYASTHQPLKTIDLL
ncbi:hypothetical protein BDA99DRAFT_587781 [Phascolomyces articulosus]|uniref:Uncharacterized protein n=1 Tax=Phascolomyces articulosus TaxID=60185 RepID=A0AAD5PAJ2_9FUNG|nr:hypothetical protein BDA99DRAFT_587781 [Phascolomyces articulosus]